MEREFLSPRPTVIVNPASGRGRTMRRWERLKRFLLHHFKEIRERFTEGPKHATEIAREELKRGEELIISVGGDGTLNEVANGFFEGKTPINPEAKLSILPSGRGNDFARGLGLKKKINFSRRRLVDLVDMGKGFFVNVMDIGLGGVVVKKLSEGTHSGIVYSFKLLKEFFSYKPSFYSITIDDKEVIQGEFLTVVVANGPIFGGGMKIAPEADASDGLLDIVGIGSLSPLEFLKSLPQLYNGKILKHPKVIHLRGKRVSIETREQYGEYDGELFLTSKISLEIKPAALQIVV